MCQILFLLKVTVLREPVPFALSFFAQKGFLLVVDVDVHLRIGDFDSVLIKGGLDAFGQIEIDGPVIGVIAPDADGVGQRTVGAGGQPNKGLGVFQHQRMGDDGLGDDVLDLIDVAFVGGAEGEVDTAQIFGRVIFDGCVGQRAVAPVS